MITIVFFYLSAALIFLFIFITGFHDEGNLIATIITSRSLNHRFIFLIAFLSQLFGTLFLGTNVARKTVSNIFALDRILQDPGNVSAMICASMLGAIAWNIVTWVGKIPSSSSHALVGGLMGPFVVQYGFSCINVSGLILFVLFPLFTSPFIGYLVGYAVYKCSRVLLGGRHIRIKKYLTASQIATCVLINAFQGSNDAQKGMGVMALLTMACLNGTTLSVSNNVILFSALSISFGLVLGGLKMIKSVGVKIFNVKSMHSMSAQLSSTAVIVSASALGFPISGTQIVNSSILGVGAADRPNAVGWVYAKNMLMAWGITIPASFLLSAGIYLIFRCF